MEKCIGLTGEYKWGGADTFLNVLLNKIKDTNVKCQGPEPHTDLLLQLLWWCARDVHTYMCRYPVRCLICKAENCYEIR